MFYKASHRYADVTARKLRPFAQLVRGMNVDEALEQLRFRPNRGARLLETVIRSAVGNAEDLGCRDLDDLTILECRIDDGPMYKRIRPRARGTAFGILKRLAHIHVTVRDDAAFEANRASLLDPMGLADETPATEPPVASTPAPEPVKS
jgi:large subunit ribosomal protein L22